MALFTVRIDATTFKGFLDSQTFPVKYTEYPDDTFVIEYPSHKVDYPFYLGMQYARYLNEQVNKL